MKEYPIKVCDLLRATSNLDLDGDRCSLTADDIILIVKIDEDHENAAAWKRKVSYLKDGSLMFTYMSTLILLLKFGSLEVLKNAIEDVR